MIQFVDALAFFFIITMSVIGFQRGLIEELGRFLGLLFATIIALKFYIGIGNIVITYQWAHCREWAQT